MAEHIKCIRNLTSKQIGNLKSELKQRRRECKIPNEQLEACITQIREETVALHGELRKIKRIFVRAVDSGNDYCKVGWVLTGDVDCCMVCMVQLKSFGLKHHCRACGNIVCQKCSSNDAVVEEIHEAGPVRVCSQCYWGQARVSAFHNDSLGLQVMNDEVIAVAIAPQHHITTINLRTYGKLVMCDIVPAFAIKARRRDRSVVYVNICSCKEVPLNVATGADGSEELALDGPKADVIFMVGGLRVDLEEEQRDSESSRTPHNTPRNSSVSSAKAVAQDSVYDVAVNPAVVEDAERDSSGALKAKICDQVLKFIADSYIEDTFSVYQHVKGQGDLPVYVRGNAHVGLLGSTERGSGKLRKAPSIAELVATRDRSSDLGLLKPAAMASQPGSTSTVLPQLAVPSHLAFKHLGQIASNPADCEAELYDDLLSPCGQGGEHMRPSLSPVSVAHLENCFNSGKSNDGNGTTFQTSFSSEKDLCAVAAASGETLSTKSTSQESISEGVNKHCAMLSTRHQMLRRNSSSLSPLQWSSSAAEVSPEMLVYERERSIGAKEVTMFKAKAQRQPNVLVGWQIALFLAGTEQLAGIYVVTGVRKSLLLKTEFRLSCDTERDMWVRLQRSSDKKSGVAFRPLRDVKWVDTSKL